MRTLVRFSLAAALCTPAIVAPMHGQIQQQAKTISFPTFTVDQNWTRATQLMWSGLVGGFVFAKSKGVSAEEYGRLTAEAFASGWGAAESGTAIRYARGIQNNTRAQSGGVVEVLGASDTLVVMRASRPYVSFFGAGKQIYGVTLDEYEASGKAFNEGIARHLGLHYSQRIDSGWVTMIISGRGKNGVIDFPRASYTLSLSAQEANSNPSFGGNWENTFDARGRYTLKHEGQVFVVDDYAVSLDEIVFSNEKMADGAVGCPGAGRYRWTVNATTGNLTFGKVADECANRVFFLTRKAFTKK